MLVLATATIAEIWAERRHPFGRRTQNLQKPATRKALLDLRNLRFDQLTQSDEWDKDDEILQARDTLAAERNILNFKRALVPNGNSHDYRLDAVGSRANAVFFAEEKACMS